MLLDEYLQGELSPNRLPPTWVSRTKFVFQSDDGNLAVYETTNNTVKTLVTNYTLVSSTHHLSSLWLNPLIAFFFPFSGRTNRQIQRQLNVKGYQCTTNLDFVLFKHDVKNVSWTRERWQVIMEFQPKLINSTKWSCARFSGVDNLFEIYTNYEIQYTFSAQWDLISTENWSAVTQIRPPSIDLLTFAHFVYFLTILHFVRDRRNSWLLFISPNFSRSVRILSFRIIYF